MIEREEERFRQTLARARPARRHRAARRRVGSTTRSSCTTRWVSRSTSRGRSRRSAGGSSISTGSRRSWTSNGRGREEAHAAAGGKGADAPVELYRELLEEAGPTEFTGRQEYETVGAKVRGLLVDGAARWRRSARARRSTSCSTARPSTRSRVVRSATPGCSKRSTGARLRVDRHPVRPPGPRAAPGHGRAGRDRGR